ncbi:MAG: BolA/IbaG family iron-sulfur metabolism protein [Nitrosomonas sp.]|nr:BolA/IbaG family iron-sulfur metabolism protein [Nitrosomonas sp.]
MITAENIKRYIQTALPCDLIQVEGEDGHHFQAIIVSPEFRGKRMIQQHQLVYQALGDKMKQEIHALSMKTFTPEEWNDKES